MKFISDLLDRLGDWIDSAMDVDWGDDDEARQG